MPRKGYDKAIKSAFLQAVTTARAAGQPWVEALKAAQEAGYKGTLGGIEKMFRELSKKPVRKPGRPRGKSPAVARKHSRIYDEATKAAIVSAALEARKAGKKWPEALREAKAAGYRGGVIALIGLISRAGKPARKPGRPPKKAQPAGGLEPIQEIIQSLVKEQVAAALARAIVALENARG